VSRQLARTYPDSASRALSAPYPVAGGSYSTSFPVDQDPMVEDGGWVLGGAGGNWTNVKTVGGRSFATAFATGVDDAVAMRTGIHPTRHFAEGVVYVQAGYSPANGHELELVTGVTISAGSCSLYEALFSLSGNFQVVRWNGPYNDLNLGLTVNNRNGGPAQPVNGMTCRHEYFFNPGNGTVSGWVYQNGILVADYVDGSPPALLQSGQPGCSHFVQPGSGASLTGMGWESFSCGTF